MRKIKDESELPLPPAESRQIVQDFVRSLSTPTVDYDCRSGECYQREDGQNWKHPAYQVSRGAIESNTAKEDGAIYPYSEQAAA